MARGLSTRTSVGWVWVAVERLGMEGGNLLGDFTGLLKINGELRR